MTIMFIVDCSHKAIKHRFSSKIYDKRNEYDFDIKFSIFGW